MDTKFLCPIFEYSFLPERYEISKPPLFPILGRGNEIPLLSRINNLNRREIWESFVRFKLDCCISVFRYRRWLPVLRRQHIRDRCGDGGNRRRGILLWLHPGHQGLGYRGCLRRPRHQHPRWVDRIRDFLSRRGGKRGPFFFSFHATKSKQAKLSLINV